MEYEPEEKSVPDEAQDAGDLIEARYRDLIEKGDFKGARQITSAVQAGKKPSGHLGIDPLALAVLAVCFLSLVVIALLTLFH